MFVVFSVHFHFQCFVLFELIFWLRLFSSSSKSVFVTKFACFNLAAKFSAVVKLWSSNIYVMIMISKFFFSSTNFCVVVYFFNKLPTSGILFSTAVNAEVVAKPLILGISLSISVNKALLSNFLTSPVVSGIFFVILVYLCHTMFLKQIY